MTVKWTSVPIKNLNKYTDKDFRVDFKLALIKEEVGNNVPCQITGRGDGNDGNYSKFPVKFFISSSASWSFWGSGFWEFLDLRVDTISSLYLGPVSHEIRIRINLNHKTYDTWKGKMDITNSTWIFLNVKVWVSYTECRWSQSIDVLWFSNKQPDGPRQISCFLL